MLMPPFDTTASPEQSTTPVGAANPSDWYVCISVPPTRTRALAGCCASAAHRNAAASTMADVLRIGSSFRSRNKASRPGFHLLPVGPYEMGNWADAAGHRSSQELGLGHPGQHAGTGSRG